MARRRRPTGLSSHALTPRRGAIELPQFSPMAPASGWTTPDAVTAATSYADKHAAAKERRAYAAAAYGAILRDEGELRRRATLERLGGVDHFAAAYPSKVFGWAKPEPAELPTASNPAPF